LVDVPQANLLAWYRKTKPNTTKACNSPIKTNVLQHKKLEPGLVASYNIRPENRGPILLSALHKFATYLLT